MIEIFPQLLVNALITGSLYAIAAAGLVLTFGVLRVLNFAHGQMMMIGAYLFLFFHVQSGLSIPTAAVCALGAIGALALISLTVFIAPFARSQSLLPLVTTITLGTILESVATLLFGVQVRSLPNPFEQTSYEWHGVFFTPLQAVILVSALVIFATLGWVMHRTPLGRAIRGIAEHRRAAESLGVAAPRIVRVAFVISVVLGAYAGVLVGYEAHVAPTMGGAYTIKALAAMVLGGLGNVWGAVTGAYILGLVENLSIGIEIGGYSLPAGYKDAFAFLIILGVLLVKPSGLFGAPGRRA
ncbi:MAG: hypothetical protein RL417_2535 [Pseudomonadota bacterium]|jgi:branched-chain amino acid transport system permease protein